MAYDPDEDVEETPQIRRLRLLVMALMVVLMLGIATIAITIVIRLGFSAEPQIQQITADAIVLPSGAEITALGQGSSGVLVTVRLRDGTETLRVHDAGTGALIAQTRIERD